MVLLLPLTLVLAASGAAEALSDKIDREYIQPALQQVQGALDGRESNWTPPILPGSAQAAKLSEQARTLWLEPLMGPEQDYALGAARALASPQAFEPPVAPDFASILSDASISPAVEDLVTTVERRFLSRLFPETYALNAARTLASGRADEEGPSAPDQADLAAQAERPFADSTRLARASGGASARPKLKAIRSRLSAP